MASRGKREDAAGSVIVTGVCGRLGLQLVRLLHRRSRILGLDRRRGPMLPPDVVHHPIDIRRRQSRDIFRTSNASAVVHLGIMHDPRQSSTERHSWNVDGFTSILEYIAAYSIPRLVLLSTASVYGPNPDNPQFMSEGHTLMGGARDPELRDLIEVDMLAQSFFWRNPSCSTVILRPTNIVGTVRNGVMEYARLQRPPLAMGFDPMLQLVHEMDVVRAIALALEPGASGIFNIAGDGQMAISRILERLGRRPLCVPAGVLRSVLKASHALGAAGFHEAQVDYLMYPCMVDTSHARARLGFEPHEDVESCVEEVRHCVEEEP